MFNSKKLSFILALGALVTSCTQPGANVPVNSIQGDEGTLQSQPFINNSNTVEFGRETSIDPKFILVSNTSRPTVNRVAENLKSTEANLAIKETSIKSCSTPDKSYAVDIPKKDNGKPDYSKIKQGSYKGEYWEVKRGDSIFLIAYYVGKTQEEIVSLNHMKLTDTLKAGRKLLVNPNNCNHSTVSTRIDTNTVSPTSPVKSSLEVEKIKDKTSKVQPNLIKTTEPKNSSSSLTLVEVNPVTTTQITKGMTSLSSNLPAINVNGKGSDSFVWPAKGKVIATFSPKQGLNKGIRIAGNIGDRVDAAHPGAVIYAGDKLAGYGNVVLLRSLDNPKIITVYAHLSKISVSTGKTVKQGQEIGLMGNTGTNATQLYFEVRKNSQSVDPLSYLPKR